MEFSKSNLVSLIDGSDLEIESLMVDMSPDSKKSFYNLAKTLDLVDLQQLHELHDFERRNCISVLGSRISKFCDNINIQLIELNELSQIYVCEKLFYSLSRDHESMLLDNFIELLDRIIANISEFDVSEALSYSAELEFNEKLFHWIEFYLKHFEDLLSDYLSMQELVQTAEFEVYQILIQTVMDEEFLMKHQFLDKMKYNYEFQVKQQLRLIYVDYLKVKGTTGISAFNKLLTSTIEVKDIEIIDIREIPVGDLMKMMEKQIVPDISHSVIQEIDEPFILSKMVEIGLFERELDKVVAKLDFDSIYQLLEFGNQGRILKYIKGNEMLHRLFYDLSNPIFRIQIALILRDSDISFQLVEELIAEELPAFEMSYLSEVIMQLSRKQLLILRLTAHSQYQNIIQMALSKKEQRDNAQQDFFA